MFTDLWTYRDTVDSSAEGLVGFSVEAGDGTIGHVDAASNQAGAGHLVVDTGPWIFGSKVLIPAGAITTVDQAEKKVYVDLTREQVKEAPEFRPDDSSYLETLGLYYAPMFHPLR